ncbi:MAG: hypothetical protein ABIB43_02800 [archaeon]
MKQLKLMNFRASKFRVEILKKGQISLQFNWIFVFIVGAVILMFFITIIKAQTGEADIEMAGTLMQNLDTIVKTSDPGDSNVKSEPIPGVTIKFVCESDISFYDVRNGVRKDLPYDIMFSQAELKGDKLMVWAENWEVPFKIAQFQYLTTNKALFMIVDDEKFARTLYNELPSNISKKLIQPSTPIDYSGYDYYKVIQFKGRENTKIPDFMNVLTIETTNLDSYGTLKFKDKGIEKTSQFLKKESLFGAIFSEDFTFYECTMSKAFDRLEILMELNKRRIQKLNDENFSTSCFYYSTISKFDNIIRDADLDKSGSIYQSQDSIASDNRKLMKGKSCPLIY